jgi:hypothetical protein
MVSFSFSTHYEIDFYTLSYSFHHY